MLELKDYLEITDSDAEAQWKSVIARGPNDPAKKIDFLPIETLICFGLGIVSPPGRNGNVNVRTSTPEIKQLGKLVRRSPDSLALKFANLDGRRPNSAKNERALWAVIANDIPRFEFLYEIVIRAGRHVGLDQDVLPDVLGVESHSLTEFLDADRVSSDELRDAIEDDLRDWTDLHPGGDAFETERVLIGTARVGQAQFARSVLENCGHKCVFCGLSFKKNGLPSARMLIASHIKPWKVSAAKERVDTRNGLAACPTHDAAFDAFLISIGPNLEVLRSPGLQSAISLDSVLGHNFGDLGIGEHLKLDAHALHPGIEYADWHREKHFALAKVFE